MGNAVAGAIRHFTQEAKRLLCIFSGSNRNILSHMFSDRSRPLYQLCDRINLECIASKYYQTYLNKVAQETWGQVLKEEVFAKIKELTGKKTQHKLNLTSAAIAYILNALEKMDYIERFEGNCFRIINPLIRSTLVRFYSGMT